MMQRGDSAGDITMPRLADGMEQGTIISWLVADGTEVAIGAELAEIETDKATVTLEAESAGILSIVAQAGETIAVGAVIARLRASGAPADVPEPVLPSATPTAPDARPREAIDAAPAASRSRYPDTVAAGNGTGRPPVGATPLARRVAAVHDIALAPLRGTGPAGRITKADVLRAAGREEAPTGAQAEQGPSSDERAQPPVVAMGSSRTLEPTRLQKVAARRMAEAKATIPHFQVQTEVVMDAALDLRADLKAAAGGDPVPSVNDLIVRATALALRAHALVNASYQDGRFELHDRVNVGIAVAADEGLVVASIDDADIKSLGAIARDARRLAKRVRSGTVTPQELTGATFTVSNLGMFGMTAITAVINPPQAAILGVGATRDTLARVDGKVVDRRLLTLTLSCDHRILNGADGARFLFDVKALLESPLRFAL